MPISTRRRAPATRFGSARGRARFALLLAARAYAAIDRRMSEAPALVAWLNENAASLALAGAKLPDEDVFHGRGRRFLSAPEWHCVGAAIAAVSAGLPARDHTPADLWGAAIARTLGLDPLETAILALAMQYRLDPLVESLFDRLSASRGGPTRFHRDPALIGLLLGEDPADIASRLTARASLPASGLLYIGRDGGLYVPSPLISLNRAGTPPAADFYDQLLGTRGRQSAAVGGLRPSRPRGGGRGNRAAGGARRPGERGQHPALRSARYRQDLVRRDPRGAGRRAAAPRRRGRRGRRRARSPRASRRAAPGPAACRARGTRCCCSTRRRTCSSAAPHDLDEPATNSRVFMHRLLERMAVPVIWTANDIGVLGPAVLRRMTMCLELKVPNLATRTRLWRQMGEAEGVVLPEADAARLARLVPAAPAVAVHGAAGDAARRRAGRRRRG